MILLRREACLILTSIGVDDSTLAAKSSLVTELIGEGMELMQADMYLRMGGCELAVDPHHTMFFAVPSSVNRFVN